MSRFSLLRRIYAPVLVTAATISAPVLSNPTTGGAWDTYYPDATDFTGLTVHLYVWSDAGQTTLVQHLIKPLTEAETYGNNVDWTTASDPPPRDATTGVITGKNMGVGDRWWAEQLERDDGVFSPLSNVLHAVLASTLATVNWRLNLTGATQASSWYAIRDMVLRQTVGDATSAVTPTSASGTAVAWNSTHVASNVLDGNSATDFYGDDWSHPLVFVLPTAAEIREILITSNAADPLSCVANANWERSMDGGSTWVTEFSFNGAGAGSWSANQTRTFHV